MLAFGHCRRFRRRYRSDIPRGARRGARCRTLLRWVKPVLCAPLKVKHSCEERRPYRCGTSCEDALSDSTREMRGLRSWSLVLGSPTI